MLGSLSQSGFDECRVRVRADIAHIIDAEALKAIEPDAVADQYKEKEARSNVEYVSTDRRFLEPP